MATAIDLAFRRAGEGISWEYPCIIWACDFARDCGFGDPGARWDRDRLGRKYCMGELREIHNIYGGATPEHSVLQLLAEENGWVWRGEKGPFIGVENVNGSGAVLLKQDGEMWLFGGFGHATLIKGDVCDFWSLQ